MNNEKKADWISKRANDYETYQEFNEEFMQKYNRKFNYAYEGKPAQTSPLISKDLNNLVWETMSRKEAARKAPVEERIKNLEIMLQVASGLSPEQYDAISAKIRELQKETE